MNNSNSDGTSDGDWEEKGELAWSEFDWERYLKQQDGAVADYWRAYDKVGEHPQRIDEVARQLGWESTTDESAPLSDDDEDDDSEEFGLDDIEPYTLHRNPVFIATRALFASVHAATERWAVDPAKLPVDHSIPFVAALRRAELIAVLGVQALDLGDYALGISQLKRAMAALNEALGKISAEPKGDARYWHRLRHYVVPRLFDLREIWLRVSNECRDELGREDTDDDDAAD